MMRHPLAVALAATVLTVGCGSDALRGHGLDIYGDTPISDDGGPEEDLGDDAGSDGPGSDLTADAVPVDTGDGLVGPDFPPSSRPVGSPCTGDFECEGGVCVLPESGFPGGYCSTGCNGADQCGDGTACLAANPNLFCVLACEDDSQCREGYVCLGSWFGAVTMEGRSFCAPGNRQARLGNPCQDLSSCAPDDFCVTESQGAPGGYCSRVCNAAQPGSCGAGGDCVNAGTPTGFCTAACQDSQTCREGYACVSGFLGFDSTGTVCAPGRLEPVAIGSGCASSSDCTAGTQICASPASGFAGGYCTQGCDPRLAGECGSGATCLGFDPQNAGSGFCFAGCASDGDCAAVRGDSAGSYGCSVRTFGATHPGNATVCIPFDPEASIGDACLTFGDCTLGAFCIADAGEGGGGPGPRFVGGYCSDSCNPQASGNSCGSENFCLGVNAMQPTQGACIDGCAQQSECRVSEGYSCTQGPTGRGCFPAN